MYQSNYLQVMDFKLKGKFQRQINSAATSAWGDVPAEAAEHWDEFEDSGWEAPAVQNPSPLFAGAVAEPCATQM